MTDNRQHKSKGLHSGLGVTAYFSLLFELNERLPKKQKMDDDTIAKMIATEFPDRKTTSLEHFTGPNKIHTINSYRYRYNAGKFNRGIPPEICSFRYDKKGRAVNGRTASSVLSQEELKAMQENHANLRRKKIREKIKSKLS